MNITVKRREGRACCALADGVYVRRLLLVFCECGWREDDVDDDGFDETILDAAPKTELNR